MPRNSCQKKKKSVHCVKFTLPSHRLLTFHKFCLQRLAFNLRELPPKVLRGVLCVCVCVCTYIHVCVCVCVCKYMYMIYVCISVCIYLIPPPPPCNRGCNRGTPRLICGVGICLGAPEPSRRARSAALQIQRLLIRISVKRDLVCTIT
jgi:hypothetical protein